jgi:hypothetical protein
VTAIHGKSIGGQIGRLAFLAVVASACLFMFSTASAKAAEWSTQESEEFIPLGEEKTIEFEGTIGIRYRDFPQNYLTCNLEATAVVRPSDEGELTFFDTPDSEMEECEGGGTWAGCQQTSVWSFSTPELHAATTLFGGEFQMANTLSECLNGNVGSGYRGLMSAELPTVPSDFSEIAISGVAGGPSDKCWEKPYGCYWVIYGEMHQTAASVAEDGAIWVS